MAAQDVQGSRADGDDAAAGCALEFGEDEALTEKADEDIMYLDDSYRERQQ